MKHYRTAIPAGARTLDNTFRIWFDETCVREYVDKDGKLIDVSALPIDVQNSIARWEDSFEDGLNEFDGTYEFRASFDGSMLRRRAWLCTEASELAFYERAIKHFPHLSTIPSAKVFCQQLSHLAAVPTIGADEYLEIARIANGE